ncbi:MAG: hypothetical protein ACMXYB_00020 [Candidatus Woesearchaeota archaeon]
MEKESLDLDNFDFNEIENSNFNGEKLKKEILNEIEIKIKSNNQYLENKYLKYNKNNYSGWLTDNNLLRRSIAVFFHFLIGYFIIALIIGIISAIIIAFALLVLGIAIFN